MQRDEKLLKLRKSMTVLLTAAQMRLIEKAAIDSGALSGGELMERAGQGVVAAVLERWPDMALTSQRAVIFCGPGNNGGDGFVIARLLKQRGWSVEVFLYGDQAKLPPDAKVNCEKWCEIGAVKPLAEKNVTDDLLRDAVIFDALFGTGLTRPLEDEAFAIQRRLAGLKGGPVARRALIAVDCPSGLCLDSGRPIQRGVGSAGFYVPAADLTVCFQTKKLGHVLADGPLLCGALKVVDIGIAPWVEMALGGYLGDGEYVENLRSVCREATVGPQVSNPYAGAVGSGRDLGKRVHGNKFHNGHVVVVSGPYGRGGAARLAAKAALRTGAGLVTLAVPSVAVGEHASRTDAIMIRAVDSADDLRELLSDDRINAVCIGPGLGLDQHASELLSVVLGSGKRSVLDADALTLVAKDKKIRAALHLQCLLTPHQGEFERLCAGIAKKMKAVAKTGPAYSKVDAARDAASELGAVVLFKGADTVISHPAGVTTVHSAHYDRAAPWLATAGSGDVLAGMAAGLMARHFDPIEAGAVAAWLHTECALKFGPGLIAEDLPEQLPAVFRDLGL